MEVFIHEEYVHKPREQRRRRGRRPTVVALQLLQVQAQASSTEKAAAAGIRLPPASPGAEIEDSPWDQPAGVAASLPSPPATAISFADHLLGYL